MRYIVTGGAGFIGSNLADTLSQHHDVVIIDNLATVPGRENIEHLLDHPRVTFIEGSITDLDLLMEVFPGADGILAGTPGAPVGEGSPCLERGERDRDTQCTRRGERLQDAGRGCGILGLR
jgi:nucleoside-diphosphate-sugar epimerase